MNEATILAIVFSILGSLVPLLVLIDKFQSAFWFDWIKRQSIIYTMFGLLFFIAVGLKWLSIIP